MRALILIRALNAAAAFTVIAACSGGTSIAPALKSPQGHMRWLRAPIRAGLGQFKILDIDSPTPGYLKGFDTCPKTGTIVYISAPRLSWMCAMLFAISTLKQR